MARSARLGSREERTKRHDRRHGRSRYGAGHGAGIVNPRARAARPVRRGAAALRRAGRARDELAELKELLRTAGVAVAGEIVQRRPRPDPNTYLGTGKVAELKEAIARVRREPDRLRRRARCRARSATSSRPLGVPVIDRTAIILDIFADHAATAEGKLQVELAQLEYNLARMRGLWSHLERLGGGIGTRGPGEIADRDRPPARARPHRRAASAASSTPRARAPVRAPSASAPSCRRVALAGYTNAGKSTLLNALTGAEVGVGDRLFHTLDPTTRALRHDGRTLPAHRHGRLHPQAAPPARRRFRGDARGDRHADLILHVVDASAREERARTR